MSSLVNTSAATGTQATDLVIDLDEAVARAPYLHAEDLAFMIAKVLERADSRESLENKSQASNANGPPVASDRAAIRRKVEGWHPLSDNPLEVAIDNLMYESGLNAGQLRGVGRNVILAADKHDKAQYIQSLLDPLPPDKHSLTPLSRWSGKTRLPIVTELSIPGGNSVTLLHEYSFDKSQRDQARKSIALARADAANALIALSPGATQLDHKTSQLFQHHFCIPSGTLDQDHIEQVLPTFKAISTALRDGKVEIKVADDLDKRIDRKLGKSTDVPDDLITLGYAQRVTQDLSYKVSLHVVTAAICDPVLGSKTIIHEAGHNVAGLHDHGNMGCSLPTGKNKPSSYLESGLTVVEAISNADSYAAFCADLRTCRGVDRDLAMQGHARPASAQNHSAAVAANGPVKALGRGVKPEVAAPNSSSVGRGLDSRSHESPVR